MEREEKIGRARRKLQGGWRKVHGGGREAHGGGSKESNLPSLDSSSECLRLAETDRIGGRELLLMSTLQCRGITLARCLLPHPNCP